MFQKTTVKQDMDLECFIPRFGSQASEAQWSSMIWRSLKQFGFFGSLEIGINWLEFGWITVGDVGGN